MTRINVGIKPQQLTDEHLLAEYREIQRLPSYYRRAVVSGSINRIPEKPCLGKGHVLFFLDKWFYIHLRVVALREELKSRGFWSKDKTPHLFGLHNFDRERDYGDYTPTPEDTEMLQQRITERIEGSPKKYWHYRGARITPEQAIELLTKTE